MKKYFLLSVTMLATALQCFAWGQKGHDVTAFIAEKHLTPNALAAVTNLLDGKSIVYWANWMDTASNTPAYAYSKTWHFKNIEAGQEYEDAVLATTGDVVTALNEQISKLKTGNLSREEERLALFMIVHFMGDMHQPMHMGRKADLGGNRVKVKYFDRETNLHSMWDSQLVESAHKWSHTEWQVQIDRLSEEAIQEIEAGNVSSWAKETFQLANDVYNTLPENCSYDYIAKWTPVIEKQFLRGGIRLAKVLNSIYGK